ncbi:phosphoribosyltransferase [Catenulispora rubra]|uniref:phosphoribosyltransferase n=1 Tax=Catenulispora rubra TaxID=280293 RepID=UPI001892043F|nr:phosphoribosyltransferase [Catenulispora rubra]
MGSVFSATRASSDMRGMALETISFVVGIAGLVIGVSTLFGVTVSLKKRYTWKIALRGIEDVSAQIQHQNPPPDAIVALGDGAVPGAVLALNLGIKILYFIDAPTAGRARAGEPLLDTSGLPPTLKGRRVLIVDNHLFTGANMAAAVKIIRDLKPEEVKTCAIFRLDSVSSVISPDYSYRNFEGQRIPIPWAYSKLHSEAYIGSSHRRP